MTTGEAFPAGVDEGWWAVAMQPAISPSGAQAEAVRRGCAAVTARIDAAVHHDAEGGIT